MPLYEYECDSCMEEYNKDIDALVEKLNKKNATKTIKNNPNISFIEILEKEKEGFSIGEKDKPNIRRFRYSIDNNEEEIL